MVNKTNNIKRFLSFALCFVMVITIFAGCGEKGKTKTDTSSIANYEFEDAENTDAILFTHPASTKLQVFSDSMNFSGKTDSKNTLYLNGKKVACDDEGYFDYKTELKRGENTFSFDYNGTKKEFQITYSTPMIKSYTPNEEELELDAGTRCSITANALTGCSVTAEYMGLTIDLEPEKVAPFDKKSYTKYYGIIDIPELPSNKSGSTIKITAQNGDNVQTVNASKITINTSLFDEESGNPTPVIKLAKTTSKAKRKYIAKVVTRNAETFSGSTLDDYSRPTNNYLPKGTVDYCSGTKLYDSESGKKYYLLDCGFRVYAKSSNVKLYKGTIKTQNTVKFAKSKVSGNRTKVYFNVTYKAPFKLQLKKQSYKSTKSPDYAISKATYSYVEITFFYAKKASGKINLAGNKIFKKYKWVKSGSNYKLRLYLKKKGVFYGWDSYYTSSGQLVFSFLNPPKLQKAKNKYGYSLKGITVYIDAGHGGSDSGTYNAAGSKYTEKYYTLSYATALANKLKSLGCTVKMTRTKDKTISLSSRYKAIQKSNADLAVSFHFDGVVSSSVSGYFMGYYNPYTKKAATAISKAVYGKGLKRSKSGGVSWHYFNLSRVSSCPVVLMENGFLTSSSDYKKIKSASFKKKYVNAIADGIMNYFISIKSGTTAYVKGTPNRVIVPSTSRAPTRPK